MSTTQGRKRRRIPPAEELVAVSRRSVVAVAAALAALVVAAHHRVVLLGETFVERDAIRSTLASREHLVTSLRAARFPEWWDAVAFGGPFAANPVREALAPLGWLLALLPVPAGFDVYDLLHVLLAGLGTAALARRLGAGALGSLVAGASLALGGYATSMIDNRLAPALAWTPWVAWAADRLAGALDAAPETRRREVVTAGAVFAVALAFQLLAGEPASILIAAYVGGIVALTRETSSPPGRRRTFAWHLTLTLVAGGVASLLLAAVAVLPGALLLAHSARGAGLDAGGLVWSLAPARLFETAWPMLFGSQHGDAWLAGLVLREGPGDPFWSYSLFLGLPLLVCAGVATRQRRPRRILLAGAAPLLLAVGPATPLYPFLLRVVPPLRWVNFPEKLVFATLLATAAVAGVGFSRVLADGASRRVRAVAVAGAVLLALGTATVAASRAGLVERLAARAAEWEVLVRVVAGVDAAIRGGAVAAASAGLFAGALFLARRARPWATGLAATAILAPLVWTAGRTTPTAPRATLAAVPQVLRPLVAERDAAGPRPRLYRLPPVAPAGPFASGAAIARDYHESLDTNVAARFGFAVLPGFEPAESARLRRLGREVFPRLPADAFLTLLGVDVVVAQEPQATELARALGVPVAARGDAGWTSLRARDVRPRAFVTPRWRVTSTAERAGDLLAAPGREDDPALVTLVAPGAASRDAPGPLVPCAVRVPCPEVVALTCDAPAGGWVVLLGEAAPGWTATVDGRPVDVALADGLFRAVPVAPGRRAVVFRYRTPGLRTGAAVSLVAWLALGATVLVARRRVG